MAFTKVGIRQYQPRSYQRAIDMTLGLHCQDEKRGTEDPE